MNNFEQYKDILIDHGIRPSSQRIVMLEYLDDVNVHPAADMIYEELNRRLPKISVATVYNNLNLFVDKGLVNQLNLNKNEAHYDFAKEPHGHFYCTKCGKIMDMDISDFALPDKYNVESLEITARGICDECGD